MRTLLCLFVGLIAAGCAAPKSLPRAPLVPLLDIEQPRAKADVRVRADADKSPPLPAAEAPVRGGTFVQDRVIIQTVEVEVPAYQPAPAQPVVEYVPYYQPRRYRRSTFPVNTLVGAGIGAIIGHQQGRRDKGALIGAGVGWLLDR